MYFCLQNWELKKRLEERKRNKELAPTIVLPKYAIIESNSYKPGEWRHTIVEEKLSLALQNFRSLNYCKRT